ncbi:hypothetical protein COCMIDRAFT_93312 [Bipolaris oryzae ATCC 44560]|uniref:Uncharacterized protein n=1 Tax=Bipolaris oryzae ATCC 44560 TaxID=930090 RepID=W6Z8Z1_COCMI|nr:uncharacterized protein COCMIDRAFT_93312 [Bipolaris oryzae ATCC 44560]EUC46228.1 hypothetical protein COCMIDRAFT_93312 [Bipolaris oryzae ATCC 44560]
MATGLDELLEFLLSEIALLGVQGASSADFRRFIQNFYSQRQDDAHSKSDDQSGTSPTTISLGRKFYERTWQWLTNHPDIRIVYKAEVQNYTLSEFEAAELHETGTTGDAHAAESDHGSSASVIKKVHPSKTVSGLREALRQRIHGEEGGPRIPSSLPNQAIVSLSAGRPSRSVVEAPQITTAIFDEPNSSMTAPRLYTSQNRVWQALTGHGIDLKKVPSMEFVLLSLIAARGAAGITQPELIAISGQDKRSVPHRTDELARKNYISKYPVQSNKMRTSLCIHTKFVSQNAFIESSAVEDVYQDDGTFVVRSFAQLLYNKVGEGGIVPTRTIRQKLGVPMSAWNKRATQGALIRLDQSGMIKRRRIRKQKSEDAWITCIQVLRAPREEDLKNLGFRRTINPADGSGAEPLDESADGDDIMKDLEDDMLDDCEPSVNSPDNTSATEKPETIPPQWTPDHFLPNTVFNAVALGGPRGWDAETLRDRIVGPFWRRPMESYFSRITNDWEKTQPLHLRHLAVIRDQGVTDEKKFLHYVYRTYANFEKAVELQYAHWEGVANFGPDEVFNPSNNGAVLDAWGFPTIKPSNLVRGSGSATLSEAGAVIVKQRKYGSRWDNALGQEISYQKPSKIVPKEKTPRKLGRPKKIAKAVKEKPVKVAKDPEPPKKTSGLSLTPEEMRSLGLDPNVRLSKNIQRQILAHRHMTGDPTSLPDTVVQDHAKRQLSVPLMTKEERVAAGLSARGRLGIEQENKIREERGLPKLVKKEKKRVTKTNKEPTLLSKQQRIALGWKDHGRLPQDLIEGLRREREEGIALEDSKVIAKYMDEMRAKASSSNTPKKANGSTRKLVETTEELDEPEEDQPTDEVSRPGSTEQESLEISSLRSVSGKRKAKDPVTTPVSTKKRRKEANSPQKSTPVPVPSFTTFPETVINRSESCAPSAILDKQSVDDTNSLIVKDAGRPAEPTTLPTDELILPSVESEPCLRPPTKVYMTPDTTKLDDEALTAIDQYEKRCSPGLYLNPYVKQKVARGRPRKALMATFRLPRLVEMDWYMAEDARRKSTNHDRVTHTSDTTQEPTFQRVEEMVVSRHASHAAQSEQSQAKMPLRSDMETRHDIQNHTPPPSTPGKASVEAEGMPVSRENSVNQRTETNMPEVPDPDPDKGKIQPQAVFDVSRTQSPRPIPSLTRKVGGWAPINAPDPSHISPYQSPYANSPTLEPQPPSQTPNVGHGSDQAPIADGSHLLTSETRDDQKLPDGMYTTIVEAPVPPVSGTKPRVKEHVRGGSQRRFREKVILDIIKRCNGVFPGGGEILRPFLTLWRERHSNIKEPSLSTISETLRSMAARPEFGLKHWNFASQNKNTPGTTTRRMFTWAHLNERSPEVLKLAHNMAQYSHQKEYTTRVSEKSLLYYPEEIRDLIGDVVSYQPVQAAPKDESIVLDPSNPDIEKQIKDAKQRRQSELKKQRMLEIKARKVQDARVEQALSKLPHDSDGVPRAKRARLASLNDKSKRIRRAPLYSADVQTLNEEYDDAETVGPDVSTADKPGQVSLVWMRPIIAPAPEREPVPAEEQSEDEESEDEIAHWEERAAHENDDVKAQDPLPVMESVEDHLQEDIAATQPDQTEQKEDSPESLDAATASSPAVVKNSKKRVRIVAPQDRSPNKRARLTPVAAAEPQDGVYTPQSSSDDDREGNRRMAQLGSKKQGSGTAHGRQRSKRVPPPTLLERLTGLTGDQNDPIYQQPQSVPRSNLISRPWSERKQIERHRKERQYSKTFDQVDGFNRLFCAFVVVSSLSGEDGSMDWGLVKRVYVNDKRFDLNMARKLWSWMQNRMAKQVNALTVSFQSLYLEAYETGKVAAIEDPETHDWAGLVRWATCKCTFPELPLPILREALQHFAIEESSYENLDRVSWFKATTADRTRTMLQLQYSFTAPLHRSRKPAWSPKDKLLKARSWVRANTATPQAHYDANLAHEKLKDLGESTLVKVVGNFVEKQHLRMRKLKRLLPGRNYNFTQTLAKKYARLFQLDDFMTAVQVKKKMDAAFVSEDPDMCSYNISRCEEDSAFAAIMTMVNEGTVRLVPQLPPINNELNSPLPKLSVWGFCEGGYNHRAIDRSRLFWDIHVVPTEKYRFGNPLQTLSSPTSPKDDQSTTSWHPLPEPPLPGKYDAHALLPIWSSIDGQHVTWAWWYRVLNLVLQPLVFMAGATAMDIQAHCPENTTELFEIQLVLDWLESVCAVKKTVGGGYTTLPGFWGAFGDQLHDTENDWFGQHVKRKPKNHDKQRWRMEYNTRHSALQARDTQRADTTPATDEDGDTNTTEAGALETVTSRQILKNPKQQYRIMQKALDAQPSREAQDKSGSATADSPAVTGEHTRQSSATEPRSSTTQTPETSNNSDDDVKMADASGGAGGVEDVDAEGEFDEDTR